MEQSKIIDTTETYHEVIALSSDAEVEGSEDGGAEGGEVIALSFDDEVEGGEDGGAEGGKVIALSSPPPPLVPTPGLGGTPLTLVDTS